jgi:hypothetical protein
VHALDLDDEGLVRVANECGVVSVRCDATSEHDVERAIAYHALEARSTRW